MTDAPTSTTHLRARWQRLPLRLRLSISFSVIAGAILLAFLPLVYVLISHQLSVDMDRQLKVDWALIEAHLEDNGVGGIQWRKSSPATPASPGYAESWFDVWSGESCLLKHWPNHATEVPQSHSPAMKTLSRFDIVRLEDGNPARTFQQPSVINGRTITLRVFRDESGHRATLRRILIGLALGLPVAVLLAAMAGQTMAGRALRPIGEMVAAARKITSDSLGNRLPNPNPHDELGQLATVFNDTLQRLESSFEALKRFTSDASHELRTPLTALRSVGEVALREERTSEQLRETIGSMLEEAQRLQDLADTLLHLARAESGRLPIHPEILALQDIVHEVCDRLVVLATENSQSLEILASSAPVNARVDRALLHQAITNLLYNAIRYGPADSRIQVATSIRQNQAVLEIIDHGPGIAREHRGKIFDRFYRIDKARGRADGGTGLGLAIAKLAVERCGGTIELDSSLGQGSTFRIVLPLAES